LAIQTLEMDLEYMNTISGPPKSTDSLYAQACSNDKVTVSTWAETWVKNAKANHSKYGPFKDRSIGKVYGRFDKMPVIVAGSGPSLIKSVEGLKDTKGIPIVSCLHNFHFMVDHEIPVQFFVTLDAGEVTLEEVSEGGKLKPEQYLEATRGKTLLAHVSTSPRLLEAWQGEILFFTCPLPDSTVMARLHEIEPFHAYVSTGGNVLGASVYLSKLMGANPIVFVGADFSFSYTKKFHAWDSKYDRDIGQALRAVDVWGNKVLTWQSYYNFKTFFDWLACTVPGLWINCTEGGLLGAYPEGNIQQIQQMELKRLIRMYSMYQDMEGQAKDPSVPSNVILY
jgi:hypothetical protein